MAVKSRFLDQRFLGLLVSCLLASMLLASSGTYIPHVPLTELWAAEEGMKLSTEGVAVDLWIRGSGETSVRIADLASGASAKILILSGVAPGDPSLAVGDELAVVGRFSNSFGTPCIFSDQNDICVTRQAKDVLSVGLLVDNWMLFLNDRIQVKGILLSDAWGDPVLRDTLSDARISVSGEYAAPSPDGIVIVEVSGRLTLDDSNSELVLFLEQVIELQ